jgi:hypothetical protein
MERLHIVRVKRKDSKVKALAQLSLSPTPSLFGVIVRSTTTSQADLEAELNAHFLPGLWN